MKLLGDTLAVRRLKKENKSPIILLNEEEKMFQGEVFAVGPGFTKNDGTNYPMTVKVGDRILFMSTTGFHVKDENTDDEYTIMYQRDVVCILDEEN
jgi:chaperonin GroES